MRKWLNPIDLWEVRGDIFLIDSHGKAQVTLANANPREVDTAQYKKAERAIGSNPVSSTPPRFELQLLPASSLKTDHKL